MVKIYLRAVRSDLGSGIEDCLYLRDSNGVEGINNIETVVPGGSKVSWDLEKDSGISSISKIWVEDRIPKGKVFKGEPRRGLLAKSFQADIVVSDSELKDKYKIRYILNNGKEVTVDPFIRIPPPR
ncbi:MAG TPA: hypothetical protein PL123_00195 [Bacteroidales bacterium]|nr:hypothetical protein [Bacteroidales bacterium]